MRLTDSVLCSSLYHVFALSLRRHRQQQQQQHLELRGMSRLASGSSCRPSLCQSTDQPSLLYYQMSSRWLSRYATLFQSVHLSVWRTVLSTRHADLLILTFNLLAVQVDAECEMKMIMISDSDSGDQW